MQKNVVEIEALDISTRPKRRRAVTIIIRALGQIYMEEFNYMNRIPTNLHGADAYSAADDTLDYLDEAMCTLNYAYDIY
jgi:hypothetical protein